MRTLMTCCIVILIVGVIFYFSAYYSIKILLRQFNGICNFNTMFAVAFNSHSIWQLWRRGIQRYDAVNH